MDAATLQSRIDVINQCYTEGFGDKAVNEASRRLGMPEGTLRSTIKTAALLDIAPDPSLQRLPRYQQPVPRLNLIPAPQANPAVLCPSGELRRHLIIPDEHNDPRQPHRLEVQTWIARYGSEHRHDTVIKLGDSATFDSVSRHEKDDTVRGRLKPSNHGPSLDGP